MTYTCTKCDPPQEFPTFGRAQTHARKAHHGAPLVASLALVEQAVSLSRIAIDVPAKRP